LAKIRKNKKIMRSKSAAWLTDPLFFLFYEFANAISITPCGGREIPYLMPRNYRKGL
jgi:hypothetical protein